MLERFHGSVKKKKRITLICHSHAPDGVDIDQNAWAVSWIPGK